MLIFKKASAKFFVHVIHQSYNLNLLNLYYWFRSLYLVIDVHNLYSLIFPHIKFKIYNYKKNYSKGYFKTSLCSSRNLPCIKYTNVLKNVYCNLILNLGLMLFLCLVVSKLVWQQVAIFYSILSWGESINATWN